MILKPNQRDALTEIINIGCGQAARSLGLMVNRRVVLEAPTLDIVPLTELESALSEMGDSNLLTVHQLFTGTMSGDMMLLFEADSVPRLFKLVSEQHPSILSAEEHGSIDSRKPDYYESLTELGNILLGAFAGSFGNLLHVQIRFAVPKLHKVSLISMLDSLMVGYEELRYAVVVKIYFRLMEDDIESRMLIVMGIASLEELFKAIAEQGFIING
jgi:chemotaxis protein CheC